MLNSLSQWFTKQLRSGMSVLGFDSAPMKATYLTYAKEAYRDNPYAHAAIKLTARSVADIPAKLFRVRESGQVERALKEAPRMYPDKKPKAMRQAANRLLVEKMKGYRKRASKAVAKHFAKKELIRENVIEPVDNHEVYGLLQEPNAYTQRSFQEFMVSITSYLEIGGSVLIEPTRGDGTDTQVNTMHVRQPRDLEIRRTESEPISAIKIENEHGKSETFNYDADPTQSGVWYERYFHPTEPRHGLSPVEAAAMSVDVNNESRRWNLGLLQNGAQPSGVLSTDKQLGDSRRQQLKRDWKKKHAGPSNAGSVVVADGAGGADFQQTGMSPMDMQWADLTRLSAREVSVVWNVPPQLLGHTDSQTYNNYRSARRSFYVEKIIPLVTKIYGFLNSTLISHYDEPLLLDYETASVDALKKEINEMHERAREDVQNTLMTVNEARDRIGLGDTEGGDVLLMPKNMVPLTTAVNNPDQLDDGTLEPMDISGDGKDEFSFDATEGLVTREEDEVDLDPPESMVNAAEMGMEKKEELDLGDCGTGEGEKSAEMIMGGDIDADRMRKIASYLVRHEDEYPHGTPPSSLDEEQLTDGCGVVQYLLWGGGTNEAFNWALRKANEVAEMEGDDPPYSEDDMKMWRHFTKADVSDLSEGTKVTWGPSNATRYGRVDEVHTSGSVTSSTGGDETTMDASEDNPVIEIQHYEDEDGEWSLTDTRTVHRSDNLEIIDSLP